MLASREIDDAEQRAIVREVKSPERVHGIVTGPLAVAVNETNGVERIAALARFKTALAEVEGPGMASVITEAMYPSDSAEDVAYAA